MTVRVLSRRCGAVSLLLAFACGEDQDGNTAVSANDDNGERSELVSRCSIVDDVLVLPHDGACILSAEQRALYRVQGAEPACSGGRVAFGGLSGPQVSLNGLQIRCAPSEDEAPLEASPLGMNAPPSGEQVGPTGFAPAANGGGEGPSDETASVDDPPAITEVQRLAAGDWLQLDDGFSAGCDLVNGADFAAVVRSGSGGSLVVVSQSDADVTDFALPGLVLDENYDAHRDASQEPVARIRYKYDADGGRSLWLIRPNGNAWSLAGDSRVPDTRRQNLPRNRPGVPCQACDWVDGADPASCAAAVSQVIPSEGISPGEALTPRSGLLTSGAEARLIEWDDFDSQLGTTCGLIHGTDFRLGLRGATFGAVPDTVDGDASPSLLGFRLSFFPFNDAARGGTWHLFGLVAVTTLTSDFGPPLADVMFVRDSTDQLRLWLLASDGNVLNESFETSGNNPKELDPVACDPCSFFAESGGACMLSDP
jgi:hypothetical protein